jgi:uncharacterized membrane protein
MLAMREVRSFTQRGSVPGVTIVVSFTLVLISIVVLVAYVHHIANSLKVDSIIKSVGEETRGVLETLYPEDMSGASVREDEIGGMVVSDRAGSIFRVDHEALVALAQSAGVTLEMTRGVGAFVPEGAPIVRYGDGGELDSNAVRRAVAIGPERTMDQDGAFGVQTLVDIAERALTDSFNDQTTATQAIDRLHDLLRQLATRRFPTGRFTDGEGIVRLIVPVLGWDDYVALAFDSVCLAGEASPSVLRRIREALEDLMTVAPPDRRRPLESRLRSLRDQQKRLSSGDPSHAEHKDGGDGARHDVVLHVEATGLS